MDMIAFHAGQRNLNGERSRHLLAVLALISGVHRLFTTLGAVMWWVFIDNKSAKAHFPATGTDVVDLDISVFP